MTNQAHSALEARHLAQADQHIADGERRITQQRLRLENLRAEGHDTFEGEKLLKTLVATIGQLRDHRELIFQTMKRLEAEKDASP